MKQNYDGSDSVKLGDRLVTGEQNLESELDSFMSSLTGANEENQKTEQPGEGGILFTAVAIDDEEGSLEEKNRKQIKKKKDKKPEKLIKEEKEKKTKKKKGVKIKVQLLIGFIIPIFIVIFIGFYAYAKVSNGILEKYEDSTSQTIKMTSQLLEFGFRTITSESMQMFSDDAIQKYSRNYYKSNPNEGNRVQSSIANSMTVKTVANDFISNMYLVPSTQDVQTISTQAKDVAAAIKVDYDEFVRNHEDRLRSKVSAEKWVSYHDYIDKVYKGDPEAYILSLLQELKSKKATIIMDINAKHVADVISELHLGEGSIVSFVTADGKELNVEAKVNSDDKVKFTMHPEYTFFDKDYYKASAQAEELNYRDYVDDGKYLYMYSRCDSNNAAVCALVPKTLLMQEAISLRNMVILFVIIACFVVMAIGLIIIRGITRNMGNLIERLSRVSSGDLTVDIQVAGETEFDILARHIMEVVVNTKHLIADVVRVTDTVANSASDASNAAEALLMTSQGILIATDEIGEGTNQQVDSASSCLGQMDSLSDKILKTDERIIGMSKAVEDSREMVSQGTAVVDALSKQAHLTGEATAQLGEKIETLVHHSKEIEYFVSIINNIAEETTLLSLNASIEAARAGDAGRGFAVVAEQIKKLADNSLTASEEVDKVVQTILTMTKETLRYSAQASESVEQQNKAVAGTMEIFRNISNSIQELTGNIAEINQNMKHMNGDRLVTLEAIESISAVTEETAASTASVGEGVKEQMNEVNKLNDIIDELNLLTKTLKDTISQFTV